MVFAPIKQQAPGTGILSQSSPWCLVDAKCLLLRIKDFSDISYVSYPLNLKDLSGVQGFSPRENMVYPDGKSVIKITEGHLISHKACAEARCCYLLELSLFAVRPDERVHVS